MGKINVSVVIEPFYQNNQMFNADNKVVNRDDCFRQWIELKKELEKDNIFINTVDITPIKNAQIILFINMPDISDFYLKEAISLNKKLFCVFTELSFIHKNNSNSKLIDLFDKIFTYQSDLIDNKKFFKTNYSFDFKKKLLEFDESNRDNNNLSTMIVGNKKLKHKNELYSKREEIIKWFETNHIDHFDLYGIGWNKINILNRIVIDYNNFGFIKNYLPNYYKTYKGSINNKSDVLKKYKFSFCLENAKDIKGWITEKIFDSLFNGCIPIYLGDLEVENYIDKSCFINLRDYKHLDDLFNFMNTIDDNDYLNYISNIRDFIWKKSQDDDYEFGIPYFINTIRCQIINLDIN